MLVIAWRFLAASDRTCISFPWSSRVVQAGEADRFIFQRDLADCPPVRQQLFLEVQERVVDVETQDGVDLIEGHQQRILGLFSDMGPQRVVLAHTANTIRTLSNTADGHSGVMAIGQSREGVSFTTRAARLPACQAGNSGSEPPSVRITVKSEFSQEESTYG